jgi:hypothetical protein
LYWMILGPLSAKHWREAGEDTERSTLVANLLDGEDHNPTHIIAFNTAEGWSRDVSEDVADELAERRAERGESGIKVPSQPACASILTTRQSPSKMAPWGQMRTNAMACALCDDGL